MNPKEKAVQLINDCLQFQPTCSDLKHCYDKAKINAMYICYCIKITHNEDSEIYRYYLDVYEEIKKL